MNLEATPFIPFTSNQEADELEEYNYEAYR
jgi:hypothetical protein